MNSERSESLLAVGIALAGTGYVVMAFLSFSFFILSMSTVQIPDWLLGRPYLELSSVDSSVGGMVFIGLGILTAFLVGRVYGKSAGRTAWLALGVITLIYLACYFGFWWMAPDYSHGYA